MRNGIFFFLFVLTFSFANAQSIVFSRPSNPINAVIDFADGLTPLQKNTLENKVRKIYDSTTHEIVVITLDTLLHGTFDEAALAYGKAWKIGSKEKNNGIIIISSNTPRKIRIELGLGFESKISNEKCSIILKEVTIPNLKEGNFYQAFDETIDELNKIFKTINL